jgi:hypothetical protein
LLWPSPVFVMLPLVIAGRKPGRTWGVYVLWRPRAERVGRWSPLGGGCYR